MLVLFETAAGYAIFKLLDENRLAQSEDLYKDFETPEAASRVVQLRYFHQFEDTTEALAATTALVESKLSKSLKRTLRNGCTEIHEQLAVADAKLGCAIRDKLQLSCVSNTAVQELMRCIRSQVNNLVTGVSQREMSAMQLGLAHSLSRYKLKFSPDKIDTMVIQGVCLLDDLDKEVNNYIMRAREWYGWHFPELGRIVNDNIQYIKTMRIIGQRETARSCDLSDILTEEIEEQVKEAAETSMGSEISEFDAEHMQYLCKEIIELHRYRANLNNYLSARMIALAPNLSILVGDLVGARLISKAGSLTNLAKHPASTLQILGAEKALFRALKSRKKTPKYGLIYHSQLVGLSSNKNKGKISRMLAAKASLATRVDALGNSTSYDLGEQHRAKLEARLKQLEEGNIRRISGTAKAKAKFEKYHSKNEYKQYSVSVDSTLPNKKPLIEEIDIEESKETQKKKRPLIEVIESKESEEVPKKKKKKKHSLEPVQEGEASGVQQEVQITETDSTQKKKKKRSAKLQSEEVGEASGVQEVQAKTKAEEMETESTSKKKKKRSMQIESKDKGAEASGAQEEIQVKTKAQVETEVQVKTESTSKKKKKRSMQIESEDKGAGASGAQEEIQVTTEMVTPSKKKKRHTVEVELENKEELQASTKKKKKHSTGHKTEDTGESSGVQEAQTEADLNVSKKKKKKKTQDH
ncbi:nucleolar protein 58 [Nylanderia fulva]|uniref:nucleolar protein 58 n=1 Tax=Nylanderia fulva TaxID=613905 RepID=UPI0010FADA17|nr:nucleolar protein 58 [Nylanderia fulva]